MFTCFRLTHYANRNCRIKVKIAHIRPFFPILVGLMSVFSKPGQNMNCPVAAAAKFRQSAPMTNTCERRMMHATSLAQHWNTAYDARDRSDLTWTQTDQALGEQLGHMGSLVTPDSACIDIGAGKSQLAAGWVSLGAGHVAVLDVSDAALDYQRSVLPQTCEFIGASVLDWTATRRYTLWHDRAVFHFLTDPQDQSAYVAQMLHALEPGGVAVLSTFDADGPARCSNLPVQRYSSAQLADVVHRLSNGALVAQRGYQTQHITPKSNRQAFQTTLFHKIAR